MGGNRCGGIQLRQHPDRQQVDLFLRWVQASPQGADQTMLGNAGRFDPA
jgi:hypothetical protein